MIEAATSEPLRAASTAAARIDSAAAFAMARPRGLLAPSARGSPSCACGAWPRQRRRGHHADPEQRAAEENGDDRVVSFELGCRARARLPEVGVVRLRHGAVEALPSRTRSIIELKRRRSDLRRRYAVKSALSAWAMFTSNGFGGMPDAEIGEPGSVDPIVACADLRARPRRLAESQDREAFVEPDRHVLRRRPRLRARDARARDEASRRGRSPRRRAGSSS